MSAVYLVGYVSDTSLRSYVLHFVTDTFLGCATNINVIALTRGVMTRYRLSITQCTAAINIDFVYYPYIPCKYLIFEFKLCTARFRAVFFNHFFNFFLDDVRAGSRYVYVLTLTARVMTRYCLIQ